MTNEEILKERERIKKLVKRVVDATIKWREENIKPYKREKWVFERFKKRLLFLIDNPGHKKTGNLKPPEKYNTFRNLEKGNIEFTEPKPVEEVSEEESEDYEEERKVLDRDKLDRENIERARLGQELKPIPFELMNEEEQIKVLEKKRNQEKIKTQLGFSKDTPVSFVDEDSEEE